MITRHDIGAIGLAALDDMRRYGDARAYSLRISSGTMSGEPILIVRRRVMPGLPFEHYPGRAAIVVFAGTESVRLRFLCDFLVDYVPSNRRMCIVGSEYLNDLNLLLRDFRPDCLYGVPSFIAKAFDRVPNVSVRAGVRAVLMYGEPFTPSLEGHFRRVFPNAEFSSLYGNAEAGLVSEYQCGYLPHDAYHPRPGVEVGVWEPDTAGIGEIAVSIPWSPSFRLERYLTGDLGRIVPGSCPCGAARTFQLLGRKNADVVRSMGMVFHRDAFDRAARELGRYLLDYRATVRETYRGGASGEISLELNVVAAPLLASRPAPERFLAEEFSIRLFVTAGRTLAAVMEAGAPVTIRVVLVPPFPPETKIVRLRKVSAGT